MIRANTMTTEKVRILNAKNASSSGSPAIHFIIIVMNKKYTPFSRAVFNSNRDA